MEATIKPVTTIEVVHGVEINGKYYRWDVIEELHEEGAYFFMTGSQDAEPLVEAGLATWSISGDGTILSTAELDEVYEKCNPYV